MALEYEVMENGWTVRVHTPILDLTENDKRDVLDLMIRNTAVVWKGQNLTKQQELDFCGSFGKYDFAHVPDDDTIPPERRALFYPDHPGILRVTGRKDENGHAGHFGHDDELEWHCNRPSDPYRKPFVYLYAVEGSKGSVTHWSNGIHTYNDLTEEQKAKYDDIEVQYYGQRFRKDHDSSQRQWRTERDEKLKALNLRHKIILENHYGDKGISISPLEVGEITGMTYDEMVDFTDDILDFLTQEKYIYSHHWEDGDVTISDQFFGVHKRDAFDRMSERLLHRIAFNTDHMIPDMRYKGCGGYVDAKL
jgi:alpha-ketoglutarate-dependent taurine dioxygenase